jgi:hypothetical protein
MLETGSNLQDSSKLLSIYGFEVEGCHIQLKLQLSSLQAPYLSL